MTTGAGHACEREGQCRESLRQGGGRAEVWRETKSPEQSCDRPHRSCELSTLCSRAAPACQYRIIRTQVANHCAGWTGGALSVAPVDRVLLLGSAPHARAQPSQVERSFGSSERSNLVVL